MHTFAYWTQTRFNFELNVHSVVSRESLPFLLSRLILLNVLYEYNVHMLSENKSLIFQKDLFILTAIFKEKMSIS